MYYYMFKNKIKYNKTKGGSSMKTMKQLLQYFEIDDTLYKKNFKAKDFNKILYEIPYEGFLFCRDT